MWLSCVLVMLSAAVPFADMKRDFAAGDFDKVIGRADAALKKPGTPQELALVHLLRGQALLALGKTPQARVSLWNALKADPTLELDATRANPEAVRLLEELRLTLPSTISVKLLEGNASIRVDDRELGPAPLQTEVKPGTHVVSARASDGTSARQQVSVAGGRKVEVVLRLEVAPAEPPIVRAEVPIQNVQRLDVAPPPQLQRRSPSRIGVVPLVAGAVVAAAGGIAVWQSRVAYDQLTTAPFLAHDDEVATVQRGKLLQPMGWVGVGVGAAAAVLGAVLLINAAAASNESVSLSIGVSPGGLVASGRFP